MDSEIIKSYRVLIKGIVQGVSFRKFTKKEADRIGVKGYVRNTHDGHVEAFFEGECVFRFNRTLIPFLIEH